jgi:hypothetical protein
MLCPKCKGNGDIFNHTALKIVAGLILAPVTLFFSLALPFTKEPCNICNGKGFINE